MKRIWSTLLALTLIAIVVLPLFAVPASADEPKRLKPGDKFISEEGLLTEFVGETEGGRFHYRVVIDAPQYTDDMTPIVSRWIYDSDKDEYNADSNLFEARVKDDKVWVEKDNEKQNWKPTVNFSDNLKFKASGDAVLLAVDPINENYAYNTLVWDYGVCQRYLRIIEGMLIEYYVFETNPLGDVQIESNLYKDEGFVWNRQPYAYDAEGEPVAVSPDKVVLESEFNREDITYPITIDPTTTFTTSASDGFLGAEGMTSWDANHDASDASAVSDGGTELVIGVAYFLPAVQFIYRSGLFFDTSGLPDDCSVGSANLTLYGSEDGSIVDFDIVVQTGTSATYPHDPLEAGDYLYTQYTGSGGTLSTAGFNTSGYNTINLNATGRGWISKTGDTKFMLRSSHDVNDTSPGNMAVVGVYAYEQGAGYRPQLVVTYSSTALPTIDAVAATYVEMTTARLNSDLTSDGGEACDVRFQYNTTDNWSGFADNTTWVNNYFTGAYPYADITSLTPNTLYYFRAQAKNTIGTANSTSLSFTTESSVVAPSNFKSFPGVDNVVLSWTSGAGSTETIVRGKEGSYPTSITDGFSVYDGEQNSASDAGKDSGETISYSAWGTSGANVSATYVTVMATTLPSVAAEGTPDAPDVPVTWFSSPDYTKFSNLGVVYDLMNDFADSMAMPRNNFWMLSSILGCILFAIFFGGWTRNFTPALIALAVSIGITSLIGLLPMWMMAFTVLFALGAWQFRSRGVTV